MVARHLVKYSHVSRPTLSVYPRNDSSHGVVIFFWSTESNFLTGSFGGCIPRDKPCGKENLISFWELLPYILVIPERHLWPEHRLPVCGPRLCLLEGAPCPTTACDAVS